MDDQILSWLTHSLTGGAGLAVAFLTFRLKSQKQTDVTFLSIVTSLQTQISDQRLEMTDYRTRIRNLELERLDCLKRLAVLEAGQDRGPHRNVPATL